MGKCPNGTLTAFTVVVDAGFTTDLVLSLGVCEEAFDRAIRTHRSEGWAGEYPIAIQAVPLTEDEWSATKFIQAWQGDDHPHFTALRIAIADFREAHNFRPQQADWIAAPEGDELEDHWDLRLGAGSVENHYCVVGDTATNVTA